MTLKNILILLLLLNSAQAADLMRESRIAEQIEAAILDGDVLRLPDGDHEFLAVHRRSDAEPIKGAAIILHGRGAHPDWNDVVRPLATGLPEHGWETLTIQLPIAAADAPERDWQDLIPEAVARIDAAIEFMRQRRIGNLVLIGHSLGARMGSHYLAQGAAQEIQAYVAIGLAADTIASTKDRNGRSQLDRTQGALADLRAITLPVLDIYGERDLESVLTSAKERRIAAQDAANEGYQQVRMPGADHFFSRMDRRLVNRIRAWMKKTAAGTQVPAG